jgi:hypothetical protein
MADTPQTLPADFFSKKASTPPPKTLPADFFSNQEKTEAATTDPAVSKEIADTSAKENAPISGTYRKLGRGAALGMAEGAGIPETQHPVMDLIRRARDEGKEQTEHPLKSIGSLALGPIPQLYGMGKDMYGSGKEALSGMVSGDPEKFGHGTASFLTKLLMLKGTKEAGTAAETTIENLRKSKVDPLAKTNELLGVTRKEVRVGGTPESLDQFTTNPARGVQKYGLTDKDLKKMNPLERNSAVTKARNSAGEKLDATLKKATEEGKTVNLYKTLNDTFKNIPDPKLAKQAETRMLQILKQHGINKPLNQLTPTEARAVQRSLDDFANFASGDAVKTFKDVATKLRRGISAETRKAVPESAEFDQDYSDLASATKATQRAAADYARTTPQSTLRKWLIKGAVKAGTAGMGLPLP